jgi:hypothetical protein
MNYVGYIIFILLLLNPIYLLADTIDIKSNPTSSSEYDRTSQQYTPQQDSNYARDNKLSLGFLYWLKKGIASSNGDWKLYKQGIFENPSINLAESFAKMPANIFEPLPTEVVQYQITRINALSIPTIHTFSENGTNISLQSIGRFLGILEDVSPEINYTLNYTSDVEIVIYSVSAKIIATIFVGTQKAGKYKIVWNGKDDAGKKMPHGDYIAEVRVASERFVRKRIVIE